MATPPAAGRRRALAGRGDMPPGTLRQPRPGLEPLLGAAGTSGAETGGGRTTRSSRIFLPGEALPRPSRANRRPPPGTGSGCTAANVVEGGAREHLDLQIQTSHRGLGALPLGRRVFGLAGVLPTDVRRGCPRGPSWIFTATSAPSFSRRGRESEGAGARRCSSSARCPRRESWGTGARRRGDGSLVVPRRISLRETRQALPSADPVWRGRTRSPATQGWCPRACRPLPIGRTRGC